MNMQLVLVLFAYVLLITHDANCKNKRIRRSLLWGPNNSRLQTILGAGFPVDLDDTSITVGVFIKGNYRMPTNSTIYTDPSDVVYTDEQKMTNRWDIYEILSHMAENYGFGGKVCILRAICEAARIPFDKKIGLLEEILHVILTPTSTKDKLNSYVDSDYLSAHKMGKRETGKCSKIYPGCKIDLIEKFTDVLHIAKNVK